MELKYITRFMYDSLDYENYVLQIMLKVTITISLKIWLKLYFCSLSKKDLTLPWCVLYRCVVSRRAQNLIMKNERKTEFL
jgi:Na+-transporting NADH:ubiquinone oxidoreductase subunit NqrD